MLYLLGFPTPVVEVYLVLAGFVIAFALYFALSFEDVGGSEVERGGRSEDDEQITEAS